MNKYIKITLIIVSILLASFLIWAGYYIFRYWREVKKVEEDLFTIPIESRNSMEWNSFIILQYAGLVDNDSTIDILTKAAGEESQKIYTIPTNLYTGVSTEFDSYCNIIRVVRYSNNPEVLTFESLECR